MQHRAWQAAQGIATGPLIYYFGSRHRSEEYLYGEEIEAYLTDKVLTHAGLAFSRDTPRKVYIQHKMLEDAELLANLIDSDEKGVFYLCGPTWPVPDVYEALVGALVRYKGREAQEAGQYLEDLKEEERYVLEVRRPMAQSPSLSPALTSPPRCTELLFHVVSWSRLGRNRWRCACKNRPEAVSTCALSACVPLLAATRYLTAHTRALR